MDKGVLDVFDRSSRDETRLALPHSAACWTSVSASVSLTRSDAGAIMDDALLVCVPSSSTSSSHSTNQFGYRVLTVL